MRIRVSTAVEKRFNRDRYNSQRELEAFASKLQRSTRLDSIDREIELVVSRTMQPVSLEIWVRE